MLIKQSIDNIVKVSKQWREKNLYPILNAENLTPENQKDMKMNLNDMYQNPTADYMNQIW